MPQTDYVRENKEYKGEIVGLISAKGGVGKTSLSVNISNFCAQYGEKALLIDCDVSTYGATTFFQSGEMISAHNTPVEALTFDKMLARAQGNDPILDRQEMIQITETLHVIPMRLKGSIRIYRENEIQMDTLSGRVREQFEQAFAALRTQYDLILLDFGAGMTALNEFLIQFLDKRCVVKGGTVIAEEAVKSVISELLKKFSLETVSVCVNQFKNSEPPRSAGIMNEFRGLRASDDFASAFAKGQFFEISDDPVSCDLGDAGAELCASGKCAKRKYEEQIEQEKLAEQNRTQQLKLEKKEERERKIIKVASFGGFLWGTISALIALSLIGVGEALSAYFFIIIGITLLVAAVILRRKAAQLSRKTSDTKSQKSLEDKT